MQTRIKFSGHAVFAYRRPDGSHGWNRIVRNGVTMAGVTWLLETNFRLGPPSVNVYAGLIAELGFTGVDNTNDTHASHPGWVEWTSLASAVRPVWLASPANGGLLGTLTPATFNITSDGFIRGAFLTTGANVGSTDPSFVLYNTVVALAGLEVEAGGSLDVSFAVRLSIPLGG